MALSIAVVGYNYKLSCRAIRQVAENDMDSKIKFARQDLVLMDDGTRYKAFTNNTDSLRGVLVDQIILVDDYRWGVILQQHGLISYLKERLHRSCVPEEFQIQEYEW